jgi:hypothetical protein
VRKEEVAELSTWLVAFPGRAISVIFQRDCCCCCCCCFLFDDLYPLVVVVAVVVVALERHLGRLATAFDKKESDHCERGLICCQLVPEPPKHSFSPVFDPPSLAFSLLLLLCHVRHFQMQMQMQSNPIQSNPIDTNFIELNTVHTIYCSTKVT